MESMGGEVVRRYIDFLILLIPTPLVSALFCSSIPMGGDQCQKYLFLVDVQTYFVGTFFMVIFLFERHLQI